MSGFKLSEVDFALLGVVEAVALHLFLFELVGLELYLVRLHVVLLLAKFLLNASQLEQLGTFVEFALNVEVVFSIPLRSNRLTICF